MRVAIIGGGASGVACALKIKELDDSSEVIIFEANNKLLKKVLATGGGRCNLSNKNIDKKFYNNPKLIDTLLRLGYKDSVDEFYAKLGLLTYTDNEGRIYPKSKEASSVCDLLIKKLFYAHVDIRLNKKIDKIYEENGKYCIDGILFDKVVISIGSYAGGKMINHYYDIISDLGIKLVDNRPGLVGFVVKENIKELSGTKALVKLKLGSHYSQGELIFKDNGVSGICVMDLSIFKQKANELVIDFLYDYSLSSLIDFCNNQVKRDKDIHLYNLLNGAISNKILVFINKKYQNKKVSEMSQLALKEYLNEFKKFKLTIVDTYQSEYAQVLTGGVCSEELDLFEVKNKKGLYVIGEAIDIAGICGGYNLWFATTSGIVVADLICK